MTVFVMIMICVVLWPVCWMGYMTMLFVDGCMPFDCISNSNNILEIALFILNNVFSYFVHFLFKAVYDFHSIESSMRSFSFQCLSFAYIVSVGFNSRTLSCMCVAVCCSTMGLVFLCDVERLVAVK